MLEKIDTLIKMSSLQGFDLIDVTLNAAYTTPVQDVSSFRSLRGLYFSNAGTLITLNWSSDQGKNTDYQDTITQTAGVASSVSYAIKAKYLSITFTPALTPSNVRYQTLFFFEALGLVDLGNAGTGAEIYKVAEHKIRSVKSSDSSITVAELLNEIDLTVPAVTLTSAGGTETLVNDGTGPTLAVKGISAGSNITLSSTATALTISATGGGSTVYFKAYPNANLTNVTGDGTQLGPIIFNSTAINVGAGYNTGTGSFTAPVAGTYLFSCSFYMSGVASNHDTMEFQIARASPTVQYGSVVHLNPANVRRPSGNLGITQSGLITLLAGESVQIYLRIAGGSKVVTIEGSSQQLTNFCGHYIGP